MLQLVKTADLKIVRPGLPLMQRIKSHTYKTPESLALLKFK